MNEVLKNGGGDKVPEVINRLGDRKVDFYNTHNKEGHVSSMVVV